MHMFTIKKRVDTEDCFKRVDKIAITVSQLGIKDTDSPGWVF